MIGADNEMPFENRYHAHCQRYAYFSVAALCSATIGAVDVAR